MQSEFKTPENTFISEPAFQAFLLRNSLRIFIAAFLSCILFIIAVMVHLSSSSGCKPWLTCYGSELVTFIFSADFFIFAFSTGLVCATTSSAMWRHENRKAYRAGSWFAATMAGWLVTTLYFSGLLTLASLKMNPDLLALSLPLGLIISAMTALPMMLGIAHGVSFFIARDYNAIEATPSSASEIIAKINLDI